jgi:hypothetical protein
MIRFSKDLRSVTDSDGAILLDIKSGRFFRLNQLGSRILSLLEGGSDLPQILDRLQEVSRDGETLLADVEAFLQALEVRGLICRVNQVRANGGTHG